MKLNPSFMRPAAHDAVSPVVLIVFNRPSATRRVFAAIRRVRPARLFVIADGPREQAESGLCEAARREALKVDWPCDVQTDFSSENLGCGPRVATGLSRVFESTEQAIILEDDCLPDASFFPYCTQLLDYYASDSRVMAISGTNLLGAWRKGGSSYLFSRHPAIWGWATWRRAWNLYDYDMNAWHDAGTKSKLAEYLGDEQILAARFARYDSACRGVSGSWDAQWAFACQMHAGLCAIPARNLVRNIGFGLDATHTHNTSDPNANLKTHPIALPLQHPEFPIADSQFDRRVGRRTLSLPDHRLLPRVIGKSKLILQKIPKLITGTGSKDVGDT